MNNLATEQKSSNCSEENYNPIADDYISLQDIYILCSEEIINMTFIKGMPSKFKNHKHAPEAIQKMRESHKGKVVWNKGLKGIHLSPDSEFKRGCVGIRRGKHHTETTKIKQSLFRKNYYLSGNPKPMLGRCHTDEAKDKMSLCKKGMYIGSDNPRWLGGISFTPYCPKFNKELKERIRERDNRTCQLCDIKENGKKLAVHHIHYDKPNCEPDLISLCNSCNSKVNGNRDFWENYFTELLIGRELITKQVFPMWWEQQ